MIIFLSYTVKVSPAHAITIGGGGTGSFITVATISVGEIFTTIVLFFCVPIAFGGFILRLLGFQKQGEGSGWKFHFGQAIVQFVKYLIYHGILAWLLIVLAKAIQSSSIYINTSNPSEVLISFISKGLVQWLIVLAVPVVFSLFWTWIIFRVRRNYNPLVIPPTSGTYIRSIAWGIFFTAIFTMYLGTIGNNLANPRSTVIQVL